MKIGNQAQSIQMPKDSFYKAVRGTIKDIKNGWATIEATQIVDKWSSSWEKHPSSCLTSVKLENLEVI